MNIKAILISIILVIFFLNVGCTNNKDNSIQIKIENLDLDNVMGNYVYLVKGLVSQTKDSVLIKNKDIVFNLKKEPIEEIYKLVVNNKRILNPTFFAGTHNVKIRFENEQKTTPFYTISVKSSGKEQHSFEKYSKGLDVLLNIEEEASKKWRALVKEKKHLIPGVRDPYDSISIFNQKQKRKYYADYVSNQQNGTALLVLNSSMRFSFKPNQLDSILNMYPEIYNKTSLYGELKKKVQILKKLEIGSLAPDFKKPDVDGNLVSLSSFRGKYVLLDFWASWCGPCRKENPWLVKAYNTYKDMGFDILGVSYDYPGKRENWLNAIAKDKLTWTQVSSLEGWKDETSKLYNISGIPSPFLLNPEGRIVAKNYDLREEKLFEVLDSIFKIEKKTIK